MSEHFDQFGDTEHCIETRMKFREDKAHFTTPTEDDIRQLLTGFHQCGGAGFGALDFAAMPPDDLFDRAGNLDGDDDGAARIGGEDDLHHQGGEHIAANGDAFFIDDDQLFAVGGDLDAKGGFERDDEVSELVEQDFSLVATQGHLVEDGVEYYSIAAKFG